MKYMTPKLIAGFQSLDDTIAEPAAEEWERQGETYRARLAALRPTLPAGVRRLLRYDLHDARVRAFAADDAPSFSIFLELAGSDPARDKYLEVRYRLVGRGHDGLELLRHDALDGDGKPLGWWLYDEIDVTEGTVPAVNHSILFTGGYELRLTFYSVHCRRLNLLLPPANGEGVDAQAVERLIRLPA